MHGAAKRLGEDVFKSEEAPTYFNGKAYIGPTSRNRPNYKMKQGWKWPILPHGISQQGKSFRVQIKRKGSNPTYPRFKSTLCGLLEAAWFRDVEAMKLFEAGVLKRVPKFNFENEYTTTRITPYACDTPNTKKMTSIIPGKNAAKKDVRINPPQQSSVFDVGGQINRTGAPANLQRFEVAKGTAPTNFSMAGKKRSLGSFDPKSTSSSTSYQGITRLQQPKSERRQMYSAETCDRKTLPSNIQQHAYQGWDNAHASILPQSSYATAGKRMRPEQIPPSQNPSQDSQVLQSLLKPLQQSHRAIQSQARGVSRRVCRQQGWEQQFPPRSGGDGVAAGSALNSGDHVLFQFSRAPPLPTDETKGTHSLQHRQIRDSQNQTEILAKYGAQRAAVTPKVALQADATTGVVQRQSEIDAAKALLCFL